ncbi:MAG: sensor histidine kinase [Lachnospiraceae bacterium]|nr:sensor histidine kinase [Lachnospiraceae bacterium]
MGRTDKIISRLDEMLTDAINGSFVEASYDETQLSRLESKFRQYLTGKETATERVERERAAIKDLVTNISHQTKTPIANICLYSQLLEEISTPEMLPLVEQVRLQAKKLDFLIQMLTKVSRLESDMIKLKPQVQPVVPLVVAAIRGVQGQGDAKGIAIRIEGQEAEKVTRLLKMWESTAGSAEGQEFMELEEKAEELEERTEEKERKAPGRNERPQEEAGEEKRASYSEICACYDARWTGEALGNVLDNAVKYSPEGSTVTVSLGAQEMFVCISVEDEGMGISEEEQAQIFERFYRGKHTGRQEGNGVGLYLTRMILQRERGYIKVSPGKEGGSCFRIYLSKSG